MLIGIASMWTTLRYCSEIKSNPSSIYKLPKLWSIIKVRKNTVKPTYVSPLPPPILAKISKEVNKISKFFKKNDKLQKKSYA